jgi:hypothetical protein
VTGKTSKLQATGHWPVASNTIEGLSHSKLIALSEDRTGLIARPHMNRASFATIPDDPHHRRNFFSPPGYVLSGD